MTTSSRVHCTARAAALLATIAAAAGAAQAHDDLVPAIEQAYGPPPGRQPWLVTAGVRSAIFAGAGYDPFSADDAFTQFSATATWALPTGPRLATAVGATWDAGSADAQARGSDTSLSLTRLGGVLEERLAPRPWFYLLARVSPAWLRGAATIADPSIAAPLRTTFSTFSLDASLGGAVRLTTRASRVNLWLVADAGYGWAPSQHMALAPSLPDSDRNKAGVTTFADLAPRGPFFRGALALGF